MQFVAIFVVVFSFGVGSFLLGKGIGYRQGQKNGAKRVSESLAVILSITDPTGKTLEDFQKKFKEFSKLSKSEFKEKLLSLQKKPTEDTTS